MARWLAVEVYWGQMLEGLGRFRSFVLERKEGQLDCYMKWSEVGRLEVGRLEVRGLTRSLEELIHPALEDFEEEMGQGLWQSQE